MKLVRLLTVIVLMGLMGIATNHAVNKKEPVEIVSWIDNQGYWTSLASRGYVPYNTDVPPKPAIFTGYNINARSVVSLNSPDVAVAGEGSTQSENSIFVDPFDETLVINSNNSTTFPTDTAFGANSLHSYDSGVTWDGDIEGPGVNNSGDPSTVIGLNGRWYVNYISSDYGVFVSYSDDMGESWTVVDVSNNPLIKCDKNHMWIDNNPDSPFEGNIYVSWTNTGDLDFGQIAISSSSDGGDTWNLITNISEDIQAGSHNQGVNITTDSDGLVFTVWAVYDSWPAGGADESSIAMAKSSDGGQTWEPAKRVINNIRGIRATKTSKNMRVNSFPVATVDNSSGADKGALYITWSNIGAPGINTGSDIDIYLIKSVDEGHTFSDPDRVNSIDSAIGREHFFPWITCDPTTGILSMVYYDDRNVGGEQLEVFCANSVDGGNSWEEFKVSDVSFTPSPIPGLAVDYMGDYLGITARNGVVYPIWTDNRLGYAMSFCSPYQTNPVNRPTNLYGVVAEQDGRVTLEWDYESASGFEAFIIYRDGDSIGSTSTKTYNEFLPDYGVYRYRVTAYYENNIESGASGIVLTWGAPQISVLTDSIVDHLAIGQSSEFLVPIVNKGQLDLVYNITLNSTLSKNNYCSASAGGGIGNEYISGVEVGDIVNTNTGSDNYSDYTQLSTTMKVGDNYNIIVTNGDPFDLDKCGVWIDWNIDGEFTLDELTELNSPTLSPYFTGVISPPPGSTSGITRMRVRLQYSGELNPCGNTVFGEVEDYSINLHGWLDVYPLSDTISASDTNFVTVELITDELPEENFFANLIINSNDESSPYVIPVHLRTDQIVVEAEATPVIVCPGSFVDLKASVAGQFDSISYHWSSNPPGYTSTSPRHSIVVLKPAWHIVEIQDGNYTAVDSVFVDTYPVPNVDIGRDTSVCASDAISLDAGPDGITYLWSTGETTQSIVVDSSGIGFNTRDISVSVTNEYECSIIDNITIEFVNCSFLPENRLLDIIVFPNPSTGMFRISSGREYKNIRINVYNSSGMMVLEKLYSSISHENAIEIDLSEYPKGNYSTIVQIGEESTSLKMILSK